MSKQINALKLALKVLEVATTPLAKDRQEVLRARAAIKEVLAQPEQKLVAWGYARKIKGGGWVLCHKRNYEEAIAYGDNAAVLYTPQAQPEQEHVATSDTSEKRVDEMAKQRHEPEPVIDKSAAVRIATSLGWEPKRKPLEGVIDVQPIGYHSLQLIFRSQTDIAKFKAAHGIKE